MAPQPPEIVAIIQARTGSTRLPGKVLLDVMGKPVIEHVLERVRCSRLIRRVVVATTDSPADDILAERVQTEMNCPVFRGSERDVLGRYCHCARTFAAEVVVRVTADDPLKDPEIIDRAISLLVGDPSLAYCSNTLKPTYPEGLDVEVCRVEALERAYREATLRSDREHVTPYIWRHPDLFKAENFEHSEDLSAWRWTLDRPEDVPFILAIYRQFYKGHSCFSYTDVIDYIRAHPDLALLNTGIGRRQGYLQSLEHDSQEDPC
jgi:spore coat polysaccharide biosynthesis protein SpsF